MANASNQMRSLIIIKLTNAKQSGYCPWVIRYGNWLILNDDAILSIQSIAVLYQKQFS